MHSYYRDFVPESVREQGQIRLVGMSRLTPNDNRDLHLRSIAYKALQKPDDSIALRQQPSDVYCLSENEWVELLSDQGFNLHDPLESFRRERCSRNASYERKVIDAIAHNEPSEELRKKWRENACPNAKRQWTT